MFSGGKIMPGTSGPTGMPPSFGHPACAPILAALSDGRALTAGELACAAGITPHAACAHLARLAAEGLIATHRRGPHEYYRLVSAEAVRMLRLTATSPQWHRPVVTGPRDPAMRAARTCYGRLAGTLGIQIADALAERFGIAL
jgi:DNA-binding transcriptional ArsR family regulator